MLCSIKIIRKRDENNDEKFKLFAVKVKTDHRENKNWSPKVLRLVVESILFYPYFVCLLSILLNNFTIRF